MLPIFESSIEEKSFTKVLFPIFEFEIKVFEPMLTLLPNATEPLKVTLLPILTSLPVFSCPSIKQEDGSLKKTPFLAASFKFSFVIDW